MKVLRCAIGQVSDLTSEHSWTSDNIIGAGAVRDVDSNRREGT